MDILDRNSFDKMLVIVVLYETSLSDSLSLVSLNNNNVNLDVYVYDNSPTRQSNLQSGILKNLNITYHHNPGNPGVSTAYNEAVKSSLGSQKDLLLLLDQDTEIPSDGIVKYMIAAANYAQISIFAPLLKYNNTIYSPCNYHFKRGSHKKNFVVGINSLENVNFLNSGLLIRKSAYQLVGGYDEKIRLYFSDFEFINRFKKQFDSYFQLDLTLLHDLASADKTDFNKSLKRFQIYCQDANQASKSMLLRIQYFTTIFLRAIKLSVHFKNLKFLKVFYNDFYGK